MGVGGAHIMLLRLGALGQQTVSRNVLHLLSTGKVESEVERGIVERSKLLLLSQYDLASKLLVYTLL